MPISISLGIIRSATLGAGAGRSRFGSLSVRRLAALACLSRPRCASTSKTTRRAGSPETWRTSPARRRLARDAARATPARYRRARRVAAGHCSALRQTGDPVRCLATRRIAEKRATPEGKARYARRQWLSEAPNRWIKEAMGFRRCSVRGPAKARDEWDLACLALNVVRMGCLAAGRWPDSGRIRAGIPARRDPEGAMGAMPAPRAHAWCETRRSGKALRESAPARPAPAGAGTPVTQPPLVYIDATPPFFLEGYIPGANEGLRRSP